MMRSRNDSFENSLHCLQHPFAILSIVVLLLNDHILKVVSPSWLTGKLSDFAGLFFFPFLVAAGLSLVFGRFEMPVRKVGAIAIGVTGLWFFLLKTTVFVNLLSSQSASAVLGYPVQYAFDATDTLALIMLLPAWNLWVQPRDLAPKRTAWIFLMLGVLASLATSPAPPTMDFATNLIYKDNTLYIVDRETFHSASSKDIGTTWGDPYFYDETANLEKTYPIQACDPTNSRICYRTFGNGTVETSKDGGQLWEIAWQLPAGRLRVMERIKGRKIDLGPYDLIIVDKNNERVLFVAMGNEGLLKRKLPDGEWVRMGVSNGKAYPTPYAEPDFGKAVNLNLGSYFLWGLVSLLTLSVAAWWVWRKYRVYTLPELKLGWLYTTLLVPMFLFLVVVGLMSILGLQAVGYLFHQSPPYPFLWVYVIAYSIPFLWGLAYITRFARSMLKREDVISVVLICALSSLGVLFFGIAPTILWIQGIIARDIQVVLWTAIPLIVIIVVEFYLIYRLNYSVLQQENPD